MWSAKFSRGAVLASRSKARIWVPKALTSVDRRRAGLWRGRLLPPSPTSAVSATAAAFVMLVPVTGVNQAAAARAAERPALLNEVARVYSLGVGEVGCPSQPEWDADPHRARFSWGYTNVRSDYTVLPPLICAGALNVGRDSISTWQQAAGVWMLVHEAFHLRHWRSAATRRRSDARPSSTSPTRPRDWAPPIRRHSSSTPMASRSTISSSTSTRGTATRSALCRPGFLLRLPSLSNPSGGPQLLWLATY
jgi:hypothetical protein